MRYLIYSCHATLLLIALHITFINGEIYYVINAVYWDILGLNVILMRYCYELNQLIWRTCTNVYLPTASLIFLFLFKVLTVKNLLEINYVSIIILALRTLIQLQLKPLNLPVANLLK